MKIISMLKKSVLLLSLMPILSIYAYDPSLISNREMPRPGAYGGEERGGGDAARGYERGYNRGSENNGGEGGGGNVYVAPENPYNNNGYNNGANPFEPPPPAQDYQNPDM